MTINMTRKNARFEILDITRFVAAAAVVIYHYFFRGGAADSMSPLMFPMLADFAKYGWIGVPLFFMISGFVILMSAQGRSPSEFIVSRVARLYPAYWFSVLCTALIMVVWGGDMYSVSASQVLINLTMLQSFLNVPDVDGVYWTLAKELVFYFWVWLLLRVSKIEYFSYWALGFLFIATVAVFVKFPGCQTFFLTDYGCYFIAGSAFYMLFKNGTSLSTLALVLWSLGLIVVNLIQTTQMYSEYFNEEFSLTVVLVIMGLLYLLFLSIALGMWAKFSCKYAMTLGSLTYPLYLLHENIGFIAFNQLYPFMNKYILVVSVIAVIVMVSFIVDMWVEQPLRIKLRKSLGKFL